MTLTRTTITQGGGTDLTPPAEVSNLPAVPPTGRPNMESTGKEMWVAESQPQHGKTDHRVSLEVNSKNLTITTPFRTPTHTH